MSGEKFPNRKDAGMAQPPQVKEARIAGDTKALSAMGRAGAAATNEKRRKTREEDAVFDDFRAEQRIHEDTRRREESGENIIPADTYN